MLSMNMSYKVLCKGELYMVKYMSITCIIGVQIFIITCIYKGLQILIYVFLFLD